MRCCNSPGCTHLPHSPCGRVSCGRHHYTELIHRHVFDYVSVSHERWCATITLCAARLAKKQTAALLATLLILTDCCRQPASPVPQFASLLVWQRFDSDECRSDGEQH